MEQEEQDYLQETPLLDREHPAIQELVRTQGWFSLSSSERIAAVYTFVRDAIPYGYAKSFCVPASSVLQQGKGNCLTKTTLLLALLRAVGIPCRLRAAMISKVIHRGLLGVISFRMSPNRLYHTWVEAKYQEQWIEIGGHIIDQPYLEKLQQKFANHIGSFYGYGIAVTHFRNPSITWDEEDTEIQGKAIRESLHTFPDPDTFFKTYPEAEQRTRSLSYRLILRPTLNRSIRRLRRS
ncbi:MAG: transglutaminase-like domain-containing protein [Sphaerochaetaceae bacterium]